MKKVHLHRFGKTDIFFSIAVTLSTERVKEPEKSYLLKDQSNFRELILEIETKEPTGIFQKRNFFFGLDKENLEEAQIALQSGEIASWYIRRIKSSDVNFSSFMNQLDSQTI